MDYHTRLPLTQAWGSGEIASADGMRFTVPVRTGHAGYNSRYFGSERGVTFYNYISGQFSGFHAQVIPGTLRDSLFILDGLLEQQTSLEPTEIMTDTAGYSDAVTHEHPGSRISIERVMQARIRERQAWHGTD